MMRKLFCVWATLLLAAVAWGEETWFGFYLQGTKVGYVQYLSQPNPEDDSQILRQSKFVFDASMLGQNMKIDVQSWTWLDKSGRIIKSRQITESSGRTNDVTAEYSPTEITATMKTAGDTTTKTIQIPEGAVIIDDPVAQFVNSGNATPGQTKETYVFAPESLTLQRINIVVKGQTQIDDQGQKVSALHVVVDDPRAKTELFLSSKGDLIKATGPMGMEYRPEPKEIAMDLTGERGDLAIASSVQVTGRPNLSAPSVQYRVTGTDLSGIPQGETQALADEENAVLLTIKPVQNPNTDTTILDSASQKPDWIKPDVRVPSQSDRFTKLAKEIIGSETRAVPAAQKLRSYVFELMAVDAGIGVMRDANEILDSKEGVCRDHAILLGTLTRAAGIPTRFISGLVYTGRDFLYHAWVEVWDGTQWVGMDSTRPGEWITPGHIKTAQGSVADGLSGFLLDGAKFEVIEGVRHE